MEKLFSTEGQAALGTILSKKVLLAFDYDGTLAPIVGDPTRASVTESTRGLLTQVTAKYPCVLITGRSRQDALLRMQGMGMRECYGDHGIDPLPGREAYLHQVALWIPVIRKQIAGFSGVWLEEKPYSLSLHTRHASDPQAAYLAMQGIASELPNAGWVGGHFIVNIRPLGAPHKGTALLYAMEAFGCHAAVFVGDDSNDEDAFALRETHDVMGIRVGKKDSSLAQWFIESQDAMDQLLMAYETSF